MASLGGPGTALGRANPDPAAIGGDDHATARDGLSPIQVPHTLGGPGTCGKTISDRPNGLEVQRLPPVGQHLLNLLQRTEHRHQLADLRDEGCRAMVMHPPEYEHWVHPLARPAAVTVAAEGGHPDVDLAARCPECDVASALILDRVARPLSQGAGLCRFSESSRAACVAAAIRRVRSQKAVTRKRLEVKVFHQAAAEPR